jgi:hypothetical protein
VTALHEFPTLLLLTALLAPKFAYAE